MRTRGIALTGALIALAAPAAAHADYTLGSSLADAGDPSTITGGDTTGGTAVNTAIPGRQVVAGEAGTITTFRVANAQGLIALVVIDGAAGQRHVVATSQPFQGSGGTQTFTVSMPIAAGQTIGVQMAPGAQLGFAATQGGQIERYSPALTSTPRAPDYTDPTDYSWAFNADVDTPDAGGGTSGKNKVRLSTASEFLSSDRKIARGVSCDGPSLCKGSLELSWKGKVICRARFAIEADGTKTIVMTVSKSIAKSLRRRSSVRIKQKAYGAGITTVVKNFTLKP